MTEQHPLTPPPELVQLWKAQYYDYNKTFSELLTEVAQYGADQELEACCETLESWGSCIVPDLRAARRPKPPSLKERLSKAIVEGDERQALKLLEELDDSL